jgi:hypothetical protein
MRATGQFRERAEFIFGRDFQFCRVSSLEHRRLGACSDVVFRIARECRLVLLLPRVCRGDDIDPSERWNSQSESCCSVEETLMES